MMGQSNAWTSPSSGNWQDAHWSLGQLPGTNQDIFLTNASWKAVGIQASTVASFPQTLTVNSLTVTSPTNTFNTLLLNFAGTQKPLLVGGSDLKGALTVGANAAVVVLASALQVQNTNVQGSSQGAFAIDGTFTESDGAQVRAGFLNLGGTFNLTNSFLWAGMESLVGTFNQQGGTNSGTITVFHNYNLFDGTVAGALVLSGGQLNQSGGVVSGVVKFAVVAGQYNLSGGTLSPGDEFVTGGTTLTPSDAEVVQTGGTNNAANLVVGGGQNSTGGYTLSGGLLTASDLTVEPTEFRLASTGNTFTQSGGAVTADLVVIQGVSFTPVNTTSNAFAQSFYLLSGGTVSTPSLWLNIGSVQQAGGTNNVGALSMNTFSSYALNGGKLIAQNAALTNSSFGHAGGIIGISNLLTLNTSVWIEQTVGAQLGQLQVINSNSISALPPSGPCVLRFADSSAVAWANAPVLAIANWSGSLFGGGLQRIIFGNSAAALTAGQVGAIQFLNPSGLPPGTYPARILADGEVVPNSGSPLPAMVSLLATNGAFQITIGGEIGSQYEVEFSSDLLHWTPLASQMNSNGTIVILDAGGANAPIRFYRSMLLP